MSEPARTRLSPIDGLSVHVADGVLHLRSERPLRWLSSALLGGGWLEACHVLNVHVDKDYQAVDPAADLHRAAAPRGVDGQFVGLLTAAYVETVGIAAREESPLSVTCLATVGVGNATSAGREVPWSAPHGPGTINLIVVIDGAPSPEAMVNLVMTATEAKTLTLLARGLRTSAGEPASGTSTDAVAIGATGNGATLRYGGPATLLGHLTAVCVREAMERAFDNEALRKSGPSAG